jgi:hypothetical protein
VTPRSPSSAHFESVCDLRVFGRYAVQLHDPSAQHRGRAEIGRALELLDLLREGIDLILLDIDEEERRRAFRQLVLDLSPYARIEQSDGREQRQPKSERDHDRGGRRTGPHEIGERETRHLRSLPREACNRCADQTTRRTQEHQHYRHAGEEAEIELGIRRQHDRQRGNRREDREPRDSIRKACACMRRRNQIAEQSRRRDLAGARQRRDRKAECGEQPEHRGKRQWSRINRIVRRRRNGLAEEVLDAEGQGGTKHQSEHKPDTRDSHDLRQVDQEYLMALCAHCFERRDGFAPPHEEGLHGLSRTDCAHDQSGQRDKAQEHRRLLDEARSRAGSRWCGRRLPSALREGLRFRRHGILQASSGLRTRSCTCK